MSWGSKLLDPDVLAAQEQDSARAANPWGHKMGLPTEEADEAVVVETRPAPPPPELGLSIASIEQRLAVDPTWWAEALTLEVSREAPRKGALRAILRTAEAEGAAPDVLAKAREVLDAL